jgi:predicted ATPase
MRRGVLFGVTGNASDAVRMITSGLAAYRLAGSTFQIPTFLTYLAGAYAELGQFDDARRSIDEAIAAIETTKETWSAVETHCAAGQIELVLPEPNVAKAEAYFEHALTVARQQQAKSWELRAAEHGAALARSGQARRGARSSRSGLRLVHGRLRHARSEGG